VSVYTRRELDQAGAITRALQGVPWKMSRLDRADPTRWV